MCSCMPKLIWLDRLRGVGTRANGLVRPRSRLLRMCIREFKPLFQDRFPVPTISSSWRIHTYQTSTRWTQLTAEPPNFCRSVWRITQGRWLMTRPANRSTGPTSYITLSSNTRSQRTPTPSSTLIRLTPVRQACSYTPSG